MRSTHVAAAVASLAAMVTAAPLEKRQDFVEAGACYNNLTSGEEECWSLMPTRGFCAFMVDPLNDTIISFESRTEATNCTIYESWPCVGANQTIEYGLGYVDVVEDLIGKVSAFVCGEM